jgi:hypothetical protein
MIGYNHGYQEDTLQCFSILFEKLPIKTVNDYETISNLNRNIVDHLVQLCEYFTKRDIPYITRLLNVVNIIKCPSFNFNKNMDSLISNFSISRYFRDNNSSLRSNL